MKSSITPPGSPDSTNLPSEEEINHIASEIETYSSMRRDMEKSFFEEQLETMRVQLAQFEVRAEAQQDSLGTALARISKLENTEKVTRGVIKEQRAQLEEQRVALERATIRMNALESAAALTAQLMEEQGRAYHSLSTRVTGLGENIDKVERGVSIFLSIPPQLSAIVPRHLPIRISCFFPYQFRYRLTLKPPFLSLAVTHISGCHQRRQSNHGSQRCCRSRGCCGCGCVLA
jgi:hypothetical protein